MSLTTENIHFIDSYLENSDVEYADIRMEMVDHIASEVEAQMTAKQASFYDTFKGYMVVHKKELLKANKKFKRAAEKKVWLALGKQLLKPQVFLFGPMIYLILAELQTSFNIETQLFWTPIVLLFACGIAYGIFKRVNKLCFSGIERTGAVFGLIFQIFIILPWDKIFDFASNIKARIVFNALVIVFIIAFIRIFQDYRKEYKKFSKLDFA